MHLSSVLIFRGRRNPVLGPFFPHHRRPATQPFDPAERRGRDGRGWLSSGPVRKGLARGESGWPERTLKTRSVRPVRSPRFTRAKSRHGRSARKEKGIEMASDDINGGIEVTQQQQQTWQMYPDLIRDKKDARRG